MSAMRARPDPATLSQVLIVKLSSIGDVVHALPVATALRRRYPQARISWAVEEWTAPLVQGHRAVDRVVIFPSMRWRRAGAAWVRAFVDAVRVLRRERYDVSIDLQGLLKSATVALLSRAPLRIGTSRPREGAGFVSPPVPAAAGRLHVVDDYLQCAAFLDASATPVEFDVPVHAAAAASMARALDALSLGAAPLIVINPSASVGSKTWPAHRWVRVAEALSADGAVVLVGGPEQRARHATIVREAAGSVHDFTGRTSLAELVALLDRCALHVAPDTGSAHIAAALGRPVVGLYGPTPPWRKAPYGCGDLVVLHPQACGIGCPRFCLRRRCLDAATPDEIVAQARRVLAHTSRAETVCS